MTALTVYMILKRRLSNFFFLHSIKTVKAVTCNPGLYKYSGVLCLQNLAFFGLRAGRYAVHFFFEVFGRQRASVIVAVVVLFLWLLLSVSCLRRGSGFVFMVVVVGVVLTIIIVLLCCSGDVWID